MVLGGFAAAQWLALVEHELLLFAGFFFLIGALDEIAVDIAWLWLRASGRVPRLVLDREEARRPALNGRAAVFIPAWHEDEVIGHTVAHALAAWPQRDLRLYVGVYANDPATLDAACRAAAGDKRLRVVVHENAGPTTKADCLNRLYRALEHDEAREGLGARMVLLHDAEDMVDPAALGLLDRAMDQAQFVQLPVLPEPQRYSRWIGSHYCEEFAEAHGKTMVVRDAIGAALPAAGVGCAFDRTILHQMARSTRAAGEGDGPFSTASLTEDYELGLRIRELGGKQRFLRVRGEDGELIATRAFFPGKLDAAVRQKARWVHGIALQGWDRIGWRGGFAESWMRLRDRRGPFNALVLSAGYLLFALAAVSLVLHLTGVAPMPEPSALLTGLLWANLAALLWRTGMRFFFTRREYGTIEALRAVLRIPVANIIAIMSTRRALVAYFGTLRGEAAQWDKTRHEHHPAGKLPPQPVKAARA